MRMVRSLLLAGDWMAGQQWRFVTLTGCAHAPPYQAAGAAGAGQGPVIQAVCVSLAAVTRVFPWRAGTSEFPECSSASPYSVLSARLLLILCGILSARL